MLLLSTTRIIINQNILLITRWKGITNNNYYCKIITHRSASQATTITFKDNNKDNNSPISFSSTISSKSKHNNNNNWYEDTFCCLDYFDVPRCATCPHPDRQSKGQQWQGKPLNNNLKLNQRKVILSSREKEALIDLGLNSENFSLAIEEGSALTIVQKAWRERALKCHPDVQQQKNKKISNDKIIHTDNNNIELDFVRLRDSFEILLSKITTLPSPADHNNSNDFDGNR
jgi:hypothetical protein